MDSSLDFNPVFYLRAAPGGSGGNVGAETLNPRLLEALNPYFLFAGQNLRTFSARNVTPVHQEEG